MCNVYLPNLDFSPAVGAKLFMSLTRRRLSKIIPSLSLHNFFFLIKERHLSPWSFGFNSASTFGIFIYQRKILSMLLLTMSPRCTATGDPKPILKQEHFVSTAVLCDPPSACSAEITRVWHRPSLFILAELQGVKSWVSVRAGIRN